MFVQCRSCPNLTTKHKANERREKSELSEIISVTWLDFPIRTCKICVFILWYSHCMATDCLTFFEIRIKAFAFAIYESLQWDTAFAVTVTFRSTISLCLHILKTKDFNTLSIRFIACDVCWGPNANRYRPLCHWPNDFSSTSKRL